jgi:hypothetical protein
MNYFVLFSVLLIAACVVILLVPSPCPTAEEGFTTHQKQRRNYPDSDPSAAGQRNASSHAGNADGTSDHDHLLDILLQKHDQLAEGFENREKKPQNTVSATTTKKKGIATTSAITIPVAGCNKDKCVEIGKTQSVVDPMAAIDGNCVNPTLPNGEPDYSIKYCAAFRPKDDTMDAQECLTCGYYAYTANCVKYDLPNNPTKCLLYGDYKFQKPTRTGENYLTCDANNAVCKMLAQQAGGGQDQGQGQGSSGPICSASTCGQKTVTVDGTQCIIPGCVSNDGGMLPYPDNFYGNITTNPCYPIKDSTGATNGFMCPAITAGEMYDMGGGSTDLCYTTNGVVDSSKFFKIDAVCSNDKPKSKQQFKPENVDGNDDSNGNKRKRTASKMGAASSAINHQHQHTGAINVYHHHIHGSHGTIHNNNNNKSSKRQGYMEPEAGASVLGFL